MAYPPKPKGKFNPRFNKEQNQEHRTNRMIRVPEVRLVGDNIEPGIYNTDEALRMAEDLELDLVEISPQINPPVCKIIDYNKFLYEKKKKDKELKAKSKTTELKEIRFTPSTDDHDFEFKTKHAERFLTEGNKIKAYVQFKGRAIMFKERGEVLLLKFADRLKDLGQLEGMPKLEGKRMLVMFAPKSSTTPKKKEENKGEKKVDKKIEVKKEVIAKEKKEDIKVDIKIENTAEILTEVKKENEE